MVRGDTNHGYSRLQLWSAACRLGHLSELKAVKFNSKNNKTFRVISFRVPGVSVAKNKWFVETRTMAIADFNYGQLPVVWATSAN